MILSCSGVAGQEHFERFNNNLHHNFTIHTCVRGTMLAPLNFVDLMQRAQELSGKYENVVIARINDHVVRMSLMTEPYFWHSHPNSDETFIGLEGVVILELMDQRVELGPGQMVTVPKGMRHRTAPATGRSINLTIEHAEIATLV
jgi:mannose-6-phosphate isomerase-like protein (cupin superfamily)